MENIELNMDERIDEIASSGVKIIQSREVFSFSIDAILLARFPRLPKRGKIVDLCAGNGAVGLFASSKTNAQIIELEIQERLADMATRSIELNGLTDRMSVINDNLNRALDHLHTSSADLIFCNPPYFKVDSDESHLNESKHYTLARHELTTNLDEIFSVSKKLLKTNGHIAMVHRPERLVDIFMLMRKYKIEPKRVKMIHPKIEKAPNIVLVEGQRDGGAYLKWEPPLYVYDENGKYTKEIDLIYGRL